MDTPDSLFWAVKCCDNCDDIVVNSFLNLKVYFIIRVRAELYEDPCYSGHGINHVQNMEVGTRI